MVPGAAMGGTSDHGPKAKQYNMSNRMTAAIVGASGYVGGELMRLLLQHPGFDLQQVTSERQRGSSVHLTHPNLRGLARLKFRSVKDLEPAEILFLCLPHGAAMQQVGSFQSLTEYLVDCSADFRLDHAATYRQWYGHAHAAPELLEQFVYGLPEVNREKIKGARQLTGVGCNATAVTLALLPLFKAGLPCARPDVVCEVKVGSSEAGNKSNAGSHHPVRARAMRSFAPVGHRHTAEVLQVLEPWAPTLTIHMSATAIDNVRGALATAHVFLDPALQEKDIWQAYRQVYGTEPFVRLVKGTRGLYRLPEPKILTGSNFADVGFAWDKDTGRVVVLCALDNLMKGAAGTALQAANIMLGWDETTGLSFPGLHPI